MNEPFREALIEGLSRSPKSLSPKWFYDEAGSDLFEQITRLEEYYPTRTETALLRAIAPELAAEIPAGAVLVEFGSGASEKTRLLLDAAPQIQAYVPIDISRSALEAAAARLGADYPRLHIRPLEADFTQPTPPGALANGLSRVGFFPGSTIGNFAPAEAVAFLAAAREMLGPGATFIVGADLAKDEDTLVSAYDDAEGVTAAFNLNLLERANREAGADFHANAFMHRAVWDPAESRIEMHLVSLVSQAVRIGEQLFRFQEGETLHTENSYKFTVEGFGDLARRAGWTIGRKWVSPPPAFAVFLLR